MIGYLTHDAALIAAFRARPLGRARRADAVTQRVFKMAPKLADYFQPAEILALRGELDRPISGLAMDSRRVVPGNLYFALPGRRVDGTGYIDEAVARGAVAVVTARLPAATPAKVTYLQVADPRAQLARVAQRYYRFPDRDLQVVGVSGTNGKTVVATVLQHLLKGDRRVGLIGTVSYDLGVRSVPSFRTTPEAVDIHGMLAQMRDAGCRQAIMEVSSHGIDQQRVLGLQFGAAVFTNLTGDHLDYHGTMESYFEVKSRLFTGAGGTPPPVAVVNLDDPYGEKLVALLTARHPAVRVVTYGENKAALVRAEQVALHPKGADFRLVWPGGGLAVNSPLVGRYNLSNVVAALATAWALGRDPSVVGARLRTFSCVPGRMERIEEGQPYNVLVDYAHTDDALRNALGMLRAITPGRLVTVFGCGGDRDRRKRPLMVRAVQEFSDYAIATADNPRGEGVERIFADMRAGVVAPERIAWVGDRRRAISLALDGLQAGDTLLVAGKGHESYQECGDTVIPFDDRQVVRELMAVNICRKSGPAAAAPTSREGA